MNNITGAKIRIPLPPVNMEANAEVHPFPFQVAYQTQEFMQGTIFHAIFIEVAASHYIRTKNALQNIREALIKNGMNNSLWDVGWKYLKKYQDIFSKSVFQNVLISLRSHWDWYIRQLGEFIYRNYSFINQRPLSKSLDDKLKKIGLKEITEQISILERSCNETIAIDEVTCHAVQEMSLVRNLGLHNRWEVDEFYISKTKTSGWNLNEVRTFDVTELESWHGALVELINKSWRPVAVKSASVPEYP